MPPIPPSRPAPDEHPRRPSESLAAQSPPSHPARRWAGWALMGGIVLLGIVLYFAYAGSVVPLRVTH